MTKSVKDLNFNSLLLIITLGLSGWTLKEVIDLGKNYARLAAKVENVERVVYARQQGEQ